MSQCRCNPHTDADPSSVGRSVRLPPRSGISGQSIWPVTQTESTQLKTGVNTTCCQLLRETGSSEKETLEKCEASSSSSSNTNAPDKRDTCCRDEIEPERNLLEFDVVRDIIIGLSDGLMVPFALTAGLSSLGSSRLVSQGGFAELIAGAISMGIGGYLSAKSEQDIFRHRLAAISQRLEIACQSEIEREVFEVLRPFGIKPSVSRLVAENLQTVESEEADKKEHPKQPDSPKKHENLALSLIKAPYRAATRLTGPSRGTTAFLITLGEGMEEVPDLRLIVSAFTIGLSYFIGGLIPIIPYLCVPDALHGLYWSILATGITLLLFGLAKAWFTGAAKGFLGLAWGAISMLAVGSAAAAASYGIVKALAGSNAE